MARHYLRYVLHESWSWYTLQNGHKECDRGPKITHSCLFHFPLASQFSRLLPVTSAICTSLYQLRTATIASPCTQSCLLLCNLSYTPSALKTAQQSHLCTADRVAKLWQVDHTLSTDCLVILWQAHSLNITFSDSPVQTLCSQVYSTSAHPYLHLAADCANCNTIIHGSSPSIYLLMPTTDTYDARFTAKCPELTKGSWPVWWYHTTLRLPKGGVLGLVKGDWDEPTTRGKKYYEYLHLAERACFISVCAWSPCWGQGKGHWLQWPQACIQRPQVEVRARYCCKPPGQAEQVPQCMRSNEESTVRYGRRVCGLLREWSELWPASYSLLKLKELW